MATAILFLALCGSDCPGGVCRVPAKAGVVKQDVTTESCTKTRRGFHPFRRLFGKRGGCKGC